MARPLRLELAGGLYHVTSRGNRREAIYEDDDDREAGLSLLGKVCNRFNWRCHAYCLMDNHYHIVLETAEANLSKGMSQLNGVYTQYYNRRHQRAGHVFQGRFKGIIVEQDAYLMELSRYVVLPTIWSDLKNQVFLASEKFINDKQTLIDKKGTINEVPRLQKRKSPKTLGFYEAKYNDPKKAIYNAYLSGAYTLK